MSNYETFFPILDIELQRGTKEPIYLQLYEALRSLILSNRLRTGQKLPPSRTIARELQVSRTTVILAFEHLLTEGYIEGKAGSGTFISSHIPERFFQSPKPIEPAIPSRPPVNQISKRGKCLAANQLFLHHKNTKIVPFRPGIAAIKEFPFEIWSRFSSKVMHQLSPQYYSYGHVNGYPPLRQAIADYIRTTRGIQCESEQIIIVNGSQQALSLAAHLLLDPGDQAWMEDPGYLGAKEAFKGAGVKLCPLPIDAEGLVVKQGIKLYPNAKLVYITPSHQYPLGVTMSLARRFELLDWAFQQGSWILEDDYDSEYRYAGRPISALQGIDEQHCVIYMGTFSKVLFPGLRLGYLVVPPSLVDAFAAAKILNDRQSPILEQAVLSAFIESGHFGRHIRKMRLLYQSRREALLDSVKTELGSALKIQASDTGLNVVGFLQKGVDDKAVARLAQKRGIVVPPLSANVDKYFPPPGLILGFAAFDEVEIKRGVKHLASCLD